MGRLLKKGIKIIKEQRSYITEENLLWNAEIVFYSLPN